MNNSRDRTTIPLNRIYDPEFLDTLRLQPLTPLLRAIYNGRLQTQNSYDENLFYTRSMENIISTLENPSLTNTDLILRRKHIVQIILSKIKYYYVNNETKKYLSACLFLINDPIYSDIFANTYNADINNNTTPSIYLF